MLMQSTGVGSSAMLTRLLLFFMAVHGCASGDAGDVTAPQLPEVARGVDFLAENPQGTAVETFPYRGSDAEASPEGDGWQHVFESGGYDDTLPVHFVDDEGKEPEVPFGLHSGNSEKEPDVPMGLHSGNSEKEPDVPMGLHSGENEEPGDAMSAGSYGTYGNYGSYGDENGYDDVGGYGGYGDYGRYGDDAGANGADGGYWASGAYGAYDGEIVDFQKEEWAVGEYALYGVEGGAHERQLLQHDGEDADRPGKAGEKGDAQDDGKERKASHEASEATMGADDAVAHQLRGFALII